MSVLPDLYHIQCGSFGDFGTCFSLTEHPHKKILVLQQVQHIHMYCGSSSSSPQNKSFTVLWSTRINKIT